MPHITVDYSAELAAVFDRRAFAEELHPLVVEAVDSPGVCKMFFRPAAETFIGGRDEAAFVHVDIGLLRGRPDGQKARLSEAVLALLDTHLPEESAGGPVRSVEVRDLALSYRLRGQRAHAVTRYPHNPDSCAAAAAAPTSPASEPSLAGTISTPRAKDNVA
ncbi:5-carboxymethyl-2-hydroxymuconate Delta-isomerase [Streptomyces sp. NPDC052396]|uniref:5-carboxymethyl-2-hydroxymuconate Delta-isomerase n=1 Tax=Streptomyces sp. NPDC052396 TaxID=3365689 RepID=UPI0037D38B17